MLQDSLTFKLSSLAPLKRKKNENLDPRKKERSAKCKSKTLLALILKSSMYVLKIVKTKIVVPFIYSSFTVVNFPFPSITFQNQNFVTNSKHI